MNIPYEEMTQEQKDKCLINYINAVNEITFKSGGVAIPKFESLKAMNQYYEMMNSLFKPTTKKFKEYLASDPKPDLIFNKDKT